MCKKIKIKKTNQGQLFRLQDHEGASVWVRGEYVLKTGKYECFKLEDSDCKRLMKPSQDIFV